MKGLLCQVSKLLEFEIVAIDYKRMIMIWKTNEISVKAFKRLKRNFVVNKQTFYFIFNLVLYQERAGT